MFAIIKGNNMKLITAIIFAILGHNHSSFAETSKPHSATISAEMQEAKTPEAVLQRLKEGNQRFVEGQLKNRDLLAQAKASAGAQHPVAIILNCMDARTPPELVFDQGIADIFTLRIAGNIQNEDILGSMEFGTQVVGAKLIAVIGHTNCGAIQGACQEAKLGNLTSLLQKIRPAVDKAAKGQPKDCKNNAFIDKAAQDNVLMVMKQIKENSPVVNKLIQEGKLGIVGGIQDLASGRVTFFDDQSIWGSKQNT
jgi:carbonic anhydrase